MYKYFIWDFDGTLFNTYPAMSRIFQSCLEDYGIEVTREEAEEKLKVNFSYAFDYYISNFNIEDDIEKRYYEKERKEFKPSDYLPFDGAKFVCEKIIESGGKNFLYTHRRKSTAVAILDYYEMTGLFEGIYTIENGFKRKPNPEGFDYIIEKFFLLHKETLGVGDRVLDIEAARAAGIDTCFFNSGNSTEKVRANYIIDSLEELLKL